MKKLRLETKKFNSKTSIFFILIFAFLCIFSLFLIFMILWGLNTSLKNDVFDFQHNVLGFPDVSKSFNELCRLSNYTTVLTATFKYSVSQSVVDYFGNTVEYIYTGELGFAGLFLNSIIYSTAGAFLLAIIPAIAAYLCAKYNYKFSGIIFVTFTLIMCMPIVGATPSLLDFLMKAHIFDTWLGVLLMKASPTGMYFFVFYAFFKTQSDTYKEAAEIDGASQLRIMFRVYFPLARNVIFTVFLIQFVALWNDFTSPNLYMPGLPTVAYGVFQVSSDQQTSWPADVKGVPISAAASLISALPITVLFIIFKNKLMGDISFGGIKE